MEKKSFAPYIIVVALMLATSLALAMTVNVNVTDQAGVTLDLPDEVGEWRGQEIRFCSDAECRKAFTVNELEDINVCPECDGRLSTMSFEEAQQLPDDTLMLKKRYINPSGHQIVASIVLSGKERASIHRPQVCLTGQGQEITRSEVLSVPIEGRDHPLKVTLLELYKQWKMPGNQVYEDNKFYAYWFVGKGRETPFHTMRMFWMASDRVFFNVAHRWAYIGVSGLRESGSDEYREVTSDFIGKLYPLIQQNDT